jgi:hypothetical protein
MYTGIQNDFKRTIIAYNNLTLSQIIMHRCICSFNTSSSRYWGIPYTRIQTKSIITF